MTVATQEPQSSALATQGEMKPAKPIDTVRKALEQLKPQMQMALPKHVTPERLVRVVMSAIQTNPKLLDCDRTSLFAAVMSCAQLGLEPDGVLGQAYLVPFKGKVQLIPGYRGLIALARNSGEVLSISAHEVCRNDRFEYKFGLNEQLDHTPHDGDRGPIISFYAIAKFRGGGHHFDVMTVAEVEAIRDKSAGWKAYKANQISETPWHDNFAEMGKKTVIRRIAKFLPMNVQKAAAMTDMYDSGRHSQLGSAGELEIDPAESHGDNVIDVTPEPPAAKLDAFAGKAGR